MTEGSIYRYGRYVFKLKGGNVYRAIEPGIEVSKDLIRWEWECITPLNNEEKEEKDASQSGADRDKYE